MSLTVSTKVELTIPGWGFKDSSTTRPGISCGIQIRLSSCSSTVGNGVLQEETRRFSQPLAIDSIYMSLTHVHSGTYTGRPMYGAHRPSWMKAVQYVTLRCKGRGVVLVSMLYPQTMQQIGLPLELESR